MIISSSSADNFHRIGSVFLFGSIFFMFPNIYDEHRRTRIKSRRDIIYVNHNSEETTRAKMIRGVHSRVIPASVLFDM